MSVLTLVRHGQASYMEEDYDRLSTLGQEQSRKFGEYIVRHRIEVHRVVHGPARRHAGTAEIAGEVVRSAGGNWPKAEVVPELDEFDAYSVMKSLVPVMVQRDPEVRRLNEEFRERQHSPEAGRILQKLFEAVSRRWCTGEYDTSDVETWSQFRQRIGSALDRLRQSAVRSSHTLVFTSGGPIAASVGYALELPHEKAIEFVWLSRNCSFAQFLFTAERFSMHAFNAIPHLDDLSLVTYR